CWRESQKLRHRRLQNSNDICNSSTNKARFDHVLSQHYMRCLIKKSRHHRLPSNRCTWTSPVNPQLETSRREDRYHRSPLFVHQISSIQAKGGFQVDRIVHLEITNYNAMACMARRIPFKYQTDGRKGRNYARPRSPAVGAGSPSKKV
ncbi:hypothetical protein BC936DRAFT_142644, partial [Jimgerdemannia flammicorona]